MKGHKLNEIYIKICPFKNTNSKEIPIVHHRVRIFAASVCQCICYDNL